MFLNKSVSAVCVTAMTLAIGSGALADDYYTSVPFLPTVSVGPDGMGATPVDQVYGKEYSNIFDHDADGTPDAGQQVSWDGMAGAIGGDSGSIEAFDYFGDDQGPETDALANHADLLFRQIVKSEATLLFSVEGDGVDRVHWSSPTAGDHGTWAALESVGAGVNHHAVRDLDGLEVWGPEPPTHSGGASTVVDGYIGAVPTADATRYSREDDFNQGFSVFAYDPATMTSSNYISWSVIAEAVDEAFLPGLGQNFSSITRTMMDVDAMMSRDLGEMGIWDEGDELLFSIRPILEPTDESGALLTAIDGGEVFHLVNLGGASFSVAFLTHGGVTFNTALDIGTTFGLQSENIDGLEAVGVLTGGDMDIPTIPEPASAALLGVGVTMMMRRRRRA